MSNLNRYATGWKTKPDRTLITAVVLWAGVLIVGQLLIYIQNNF